MTALGIGAREQLPWQVAHEALSRLARVRAAADVEEGRWLLAAERAAVHVHIGYGSFSEYIERLFGYQPRSLQEKLRVAEALQGLPALARALSGGELSWSAVRELTRVAVRGTEQEWLEFARGKTLRQLEQVLAHRRPGDTAASPPDLSAQRHTLRFDVAAETLALFREALSELRRRAGGPLSDDSALLELARCVLGGPSNDGRASYQVVLNVCPECSNGMQQAAGGLVPVGPDVVEMAECDAQHVDLMAVPIPGPSSAPVNDLERDEERHEDREERADTSDPAGPSGAHVGARRSSRSIDSRTVQVDAAARLEQPAAGGRAAAGSSMANSCSQTNEQRSAGALEHQTGQVDASATQDSTHVGANEWRKLELPGEPAPGGGRIRQPSQRERRPVRAPDRASGRIRYQDSAHVSASARPSSGALESQTAPEDPCATPERRGAARRAAAGRDLANSSSQTNGSVGAARVLPRAKQTIPPALRRAVMLRDQHRCQVPGCSNAGWIDVHHIELRSEGGRHSLQNLVCVCGAHHRAVHHGGLRLERSESGAIRVRHADGTEYGRTVDPQRLELRAKVFSALRHLGFREALVRAALEQLQQEPAGAQTSFDGLLRAALARLCPAGAQR